MKSACVGVLSIIICYLFIYTGNFDLTHFLSICQLSSLCGTFCILLARHNPVVSFSEFTSANFFTND